MADPKLSTAARLLRDHARDQISLLERRVHKDGLLHDMLDIMFWKGVLQGIEGKCLGWPPTVTPLQADNYLQQAKKDFRP